MEFLIGVAVALALLWFFISLGRRQKDRELATGYAAAMREAQLRLDADSMLRLQQQLRELEVVANAQGISQRLSIDETRRMRTIACIQQIYSFLEIERMFEGPAGQRVGS